jgi:hypothetical protein
MGIYILSKILLCFAKEQIDLSVNAFDFYSGGAQFKFQPGH